MRIESNNIPIAGRAVERIRVDRIGTVGERELWWVALSFTDETTKPEGMFTDRAQAMELAGELAAEHNVRVTVQDIA